MSDLISRQAAISAICNACGKIDCDKMDKCEKLQLPPANCSEFPNNSDTISRQAAIDIFDDYNIAVENGELEAYSRDRKRLLGLPTIQPEPHEGHWIWVAGDLECSKCHTRYPDLYPDYDNAVACPHCGAKMKGERQK